jgi:large subunit ribosomal protein L17
MFRNMVTSLFKYGKIKTTDAKAKELRRWADQMITLAKRGDLHSRRQALSVIIEKNVAHKLFEEASDKFGSKPGGYTRITKIGKRAGDAANISLIELVSSEEGTGKKKSRKKKETIKKEDTNKESETSEVKEDIETKENSESEDIKTEEADKETDSPIESKETKEEVEKDK